MSQTDETKQEPNLETTDAQPCSNRRARRKEAAVARRSKRGQRQASGKK